MNKLINILIVDDSQSDVDLLIETFNHLEMKSKLSIAGDGEQALRYLEKQGEYTGADTPDLIILDYNLPNINGMEVLKFIKTHERLKVIPVIMLTTSDAEEDIKNAYDNHVNCFCSKPKNLKNYIHLINLLDQFWLHLVKLPVTR